MTAAGRKALDVARTQIGLRETTGRNDGPPAQRYMHGDELPWCAGFLAWCFQRAGYPLPGEHWQIRQAAAMEDALRRVGCYAERDQHVPEPGDLIFFRWRIGSDPGPGRHVGIVEQATEHNVYTIEGNAGNCVSRRHYKRDDVRIVGWGWRADDEQG